MSEELGCIVIVSGKNKTLDKTNTAERSKISNTKIKLWIPTEYAEDLKINYNDQRYLLSDLAAKKDTSTTKAISLQIKNKGYLISIHVENSLNTLELLDNLNQSTWSLNINTLHAPAWLSEVHQLRKLGKIAPLHELLTSLKAPKSDIEHALKYFYLGRVYLAKGNTENAINALDRSSELFNQLGSINKVLDNQTLLAYIYLQLVDDLVLAKSTIDSLVATSNDASSLFFVNYYKGTLYAYLGDHRKAESYINEAIKIASDFELQSYLGDARFIFSKILIESGRIEKAVEIRKSLLSNNLEQCKKALYLDGLGWAKLQQADSFQNSNKAHLKESINTLKQAISITEADCKTRDSLKVNILINLAMAYVHDQDFERAQATVERINQLKSKLSYQQKLDLQEIQGQLHLNSDKLHQALNSFNALLKYSEALKYSKSTIKSLVGLAQTYERLGESNAAIKHYEHASELVFNHSLTVPISSSQPNFISNLSNFSHKYVEFLYRNNRIEDALRVSRKFRANWMQDLFRFSQINSQNLNNNATWIATLKRIRQIRNDIVEHQSIIWTLPKDRIHLSDTALLEKKKELAKLFDLAVSIVNQTAIKDGVNLLAPRKNELYLFFYPTINGWLGFAQSDNEISTHLVTNQQATNLSTQELAQQWIDSFATKISQVEDLKIYPFGALKNVDFQSLNYKKDLLINHKNVHYGVDLVRPSNMQPERGDSINSLIVANSLGDLKETENEATTITRFTKQVNWQSHLLKTQETQFTLVKNQLERSQHFHYAGHIFKDKNQSTQYILPLADNAYLDINDIIILKQAPRWVVLSACNSAKSSFSAIAESVGLAQAFIISGSEKVIASSRPVLDEQANVLMTKFYKKWISSGDFSASFRKTQIELIKEDPEADWLAFRILEL
ncbi:CHAT domain-containing protein [Aliikangiella marina]|uniref:CHAT domain-containing protein n=1 Tax=Aliikangiella marina TaxID=1712262 RepID=UPI00163DE119|nr:CHAT domain-containing protein [Aliikangiella marina]